MQQCLFYLLAVLSPGESMVVIPDILTQASLSFTRTPILIMNQRLLEKGNTHEF